MKDTETIKNPLLKAPKNYVKGVKFEGFPCIIAAFNQC